MRLDSGHCLWCGYLSLRMDYDEHARALVDRARDGDDEAARELIRQLYPMVAKIVRCYRPRRAAEEDLTQMIFIKVSGGKVALYVKTDGAPGYRYALSPRT